MKFLNKVLYIMSYKHKKTLLILTFLIFIGMLFEILGLGIILPIISLLNNPQNVYKYKISKYIFNLLGNPNNTLVLILSMSALAFLYLIKALYLTFLNWKQSQFSSNFTAHISQKLYEGYMYMPYKTHLERNSAILIRNIQNEVSIFTSLTQSIIFLSSEISVIGGVIILLISLEPIGAMIIGLFLFISILFYYTISKKYISKWGEKRQEYSANISMNLMQGLGGIKDIKLMGKEKYFLKNFKIGNNKLSSINSKINTTDQLPRLYLEFIAVASLSGLIISMVILNKPVDKIVPILGIFVAAAFRMIPSVNKIMYSSQRVVYSMPVLDLLYNEFKMFREVNKNNFNNYLTINFKYKFCLKDIHFKYESSPHNTLKNINFEFYKGESIGIIGESGAGKSTLVDLILGLLQKNSGKIYVDNIELSEENVSSWQKNIAYVPQSIFLIDDSIRKNIALGFEESEINEELIIKSVNEANLNNFIKDLPDGLNTIVGERGVRLSGGQKQRIGIARALYRQAEILVFDEATSALDNETEISVMNAINDLKNSKTLIVIAHRLSTVSNCHKIIRMSKGEIIESGTAEEVLKN
jgi:ABC-type multidrug transport system fused ATPase/permease subunit